MESRKPVLLQPLIRFADRVPAEGSQFIDVSLSVSYVHQISKFAHAVHEFLASGEHLANSNCKL
jgi:hypothetical protein